MGRMQYAPTSTPVSACVGQLLGYGVQTGHNALALSGSGGTIAIDVVRQLSGVDPCGATHSAQCDHVAVVLEQGSGGELEVEDILPAHDPFGQFALVCPLTMELQGRGISLFHLAGCFTGGHTTDYIRRRCSEIVTRPFHNYGQFLIHISLFSFLYVEAFSAQSTPSRLFADAVYHELALRFAHLSVYRHGAPFRRMLELSVRPSLPSQIPSISLQPRDDFGRFHSIHCRLFPSCIVLFSEAKIARRASVAIYINVSPASRMIIKSGRLVIHRTGSAPK